MKELKCLNCNQPFDRQQGHRCLNSRWMLVTEDRNKISEDIVDGLIENEFISLARKQLPDLSSVCSEIFNKISDPKADSSLSKDVTSENHQQIGSSPVSFPEKSEAYATRSVSDVDAVPGPSHLPFNESKGSVSQEVFQPKPYHAEPAHVKRWTCNICRKVYKKVYHLKRHMQIHVGEKRHRCDVCGKSFLRKYGLKVAHRDSYR
ncbi:Zinc finger protein 69 like protein [Argiope bruennichi]|uniref:Zinc finger protein 69 like protein n=1 Tax=Argiope bruennichi TaxID=94029 RepID=A0A8T0FB42_ARGBR|nr:Zinc finger protein 69 like protein [Argiope bruennichi]